MIWKCSDNILSYVQCIVTGNLLVDLVLGNVLLVITFLGIM